MMLPSMYCCSVSGSGSPACRRSRVTFRTTLATINNGQALLRPDPGRGRADPPHVGGLAAAGGDRNRLGPADAALLAVLLDRCRASACYDPVAMVPPIWVVVEYEILEGRNVVAHVPAVRP